LKQVNNPLTSCFVWQSEVFLLAITSISKIRNLYLIRIIFYFDERNMYNAKNCDLDLSVNWFELLFRNIELQRAFHKHHEY